MKTVATPAVPGIEMRGLLQQELDRRTLANRAYSLRAFARDLGTDHATLSQVLRRRRTLTAPMIREFGHRLQLSDRQIENLVLAETLLTDEPSVPAVEVEPSIAVDPLHFAILELTKLSDFRTDSRWIASALGTTVDEVNIALVRLLANGLLQMERPGGWQDLAPVAIAAAPAGRRHSPAEAGRLDSVTTIAVHRDRLPLVAQLVEKFRRELALLLRNETTGDDIYQLRIVLDPLTTSSTTPEFPSCHAR